MSDFLKKRGFLFVALIVLVAVPLGLKLLGSGSTEIKSVSSEKWKGAKSAPILITEYSDFQCGACKAAQPELEKIMKAFDGKVKVNFRHFPLAGHKHSLVAHQAAECANQQNKFWVYHDLLFETQDVWGKTENPTGNLIDYAGKAGIDLKEFAVCLEETSTLPTVQEERKSGELLEVTSTPTFFINGKRFVGGRVLAGEAPAWIQEELTK